METTPGVLPPKKDVMLALLQRSSVFIHLDPRNEGVRVPPWFKKQPQLVLQVGLNMAVQIMDLEVQDDSVSCTLSFSRSPFFCYVPWASVFALVGEDGKGMMWPEDVPKEVAAQQGERVQKEQAREKAKDRVRPVHAADTPRKADKPSTPKKTARASATADPDGQKATRAPAQEGGSGAKTARESKRPLPPYLRVVK